MTHLRRMLHGTVESWPLRGKWIISRKLSQVRSSYDKSPKPSFSLPMSVVSDIGLRTRYDYEKIKITEIIFNKTMHGARQGGKRTVAITDFQL